LKTHPAADVVRVTEAFIAAADGSHDKTEREPGLALTRYDRRMLGVFVEDAHSLPTGALTIEKHVGYRFCGFAGAEPPEILAFFAEIKSHAGTWPSHEQRVKDRCEGLIFESRRLVDDLGEVIDGIKAGDAAKSATRDRLLRLLQGVQARAAEERDLTDRAAANLLDFATVIHDSLAPRMVDKLVLIADTAFNTDVFMLRAKMRRLLKEITDKERAYTRAAKADEFNLLGRRIERSLYSEKTVAAHTALEEVIHEYKKVIGQVAIPFRLQKSLGMRRVALANAELASRSGAQGLRHLATLWATTAAALDEYVSAFEAAKRPAELKAVRKQLKALVGAWKKIEELEAVNEDTLD